MCTQGMPWNLLYVLQISKRRTFQELATKAHDMEVMIASRCDNSFYSIESRKEKVEFKKNVNFSKSTTKEAMSTSTSQPIRITGNPKLESKKSPSFKVATKSVPHWKSFMKRSTHFLSQICQAC